MREIRPSGSERGGAGTKHRSPYPYASSTGWRGASGRDCVARCRGDWIPPRADAGGVSEGPVGRFPDAAGRPGEDRVCTNISVVVYRWGMVEKPLVWVGSALEDVRAFPDDARRQTGYQLRRVQRGLMPDDWKAMVSIGHGVYEIRVHTEVEHRALYVAKHAEAIYVLHGFEKRTRATRQTDIDIAKQRLADVQRERKLP